MKKSIYSLVLADDIIRAIDQLAYQQNTSRSNMVNQILAEHLSLSTPEMQMRDIFSSMEQMMTDSFQLLSQSSASMRAMRTQLPFKYKPTVRYQLELYRESGEALGQIRISLRTQSAQLIRLLELFFDIWASLEDHYVAPQLGHAIKRGSGPGWMSRELYHPGRRQICSSEDVGNALAEYVRLMDQAIRLFFSLADRDLPQITARLEELMRENVADPGLLLL